MSTNSRSTVTHTKLPRAPSVASFPDYPACWYFFGRTAELHRGPRSKRLLGRDLVAFQMQSGRVAVLDARCSHLGADLGRGDVVGETLRCPFHHWRYGCDGRCEGVPASDEIPAFARQQSYPAVERHGLVFFFNGNDALFPLPFFDKEKLAEFVAAQPFSFVARSSWFMVAAQGFDTQHFESVHDRRLLRPPEVDCPAPYARRNRYHAEILGECVRDRVLRRIVGSTVTLTVVNWGGALMAVKAEFPRACSRFLVFCEPTEDERTLVHVIVFARRGLPSLGQPIRRWLTRAHLEAEARQIRETQYRPTRFIAADQDMVECFRWLAGLPQRPLTPTSEPNIHPRNATNHTTPHSPSLP